MTELASAVDEVLLGLAGGGCRVERKQYRAYQPAAELRLCLPAAEDHGVRLLADPKEVGLVPVLRGT
jgi:hypothetical protein